jgi:hypothetical protein
MKFSEWRRSKAAWDSWWTLLITFPWLIGLAILVPEGWQSHLIAGREQTTAGIVIAYNRSSHNECTYVFTVQSKQFTGKDGCPTAPAVIGQQVWVYFDPNDPQKSLLEGYAEKSQSDLGVCEFMLVGISILAGIIAVSKIRTRPNSIRHG